MGEHPWKKTLTLLFFLSLKTFETTKQEPGIKEGAADWRQFTRQHRYYLQSFSKFRITLHVPPPPKISHPTNFSAQLFPDFLVQAGTCYPRPGQKSVWKVGRFTHLHHFTPMRPTFRLKKREILSLSPWNFSWACGLRGTLNSNFFSEPLGFHFRFRRIM